MDDTISWIKKDEGEFLRIANGQYRTIISGRQTGGRFAKIEMNVPSGAGPGPHAHKYIEEVFYVAAGAVEFRSEAGRFIARVGDTVRIPRGGAVHAFKNTFPAEAKLICTVYPAGLEEMFAEVGKADPSSAKAIAEKFGNEFFPPDYLD